MLERTGPVSPDTANRCHDQSGDQPDNSARECGRKPELDDGERSSGRIGKEADNQPDDPASHTGRDSGDARPSGEHRQATYPHDKRLHLAKLSHTQRGAAGGHGRVHRVQDSLSLEGAYPPCHDDNLGIRGLNSGGAPRAVFAPFDCSARGSRAGGRQERVRDPLHVSRVRAATATDDRDPGVLRTQSHVIAG
jgi:hypothetical protein